MHLLLLIAALAAAPATLPEIERASIAGHDLAVLRLLSTAPRAVQRSPRAALNVVGSLRFTNERCDDDGWYADVEIRVGDVARWGTFDGKRPHAFAGLATPMLGAVHAHARAQIARGRVLLARDRIVDAEEALLAAALSLPVRPRELEQLLVERHGIAVPLLGVVASRSPFGPFHWADEWHRIFRLPVMAVPPPPAPSPRFRAIEPPDGLTRSP